MYSIINKSQRKIDKSPLSSILCFFCDFRMLFANKSVKGYENILSRNKHTLPLPLTDSPDFLASQQ